MKIIIEAVKKCVAFTVLMVLALLIFFMLFGKFIFPSDAFITIWLITVVVFIFVVAPFLPKIADFISEQLGL